MNVLSGDALVGAEPEGFMTAGRFAAGFAPHVARHDVPILEDTRVNRLQRFGDGYRVQTDCGDIRADSAVIATGACAIPKLPVFAGGVPTQVTQTTPIHYRRPSDLADGPVLVVGASASGLQLAREIALSGRKVTLSVGSHGRLPRSYRGVDILRWMHLVRAFDEPFTKVDDLERARRTPSLPLIGSPDRETLDLNALQAMGVEIVGRAQDIRDGCVLFSGGLANLCASADQKMNRLLDRIDTWIREHDRPGQVDPKHRFPPTGFPRSPRLSARLDEFKAIVWATGFTPDHRFVDLPVFDRKGRIEHFGGMVEPRLCVMGLPHMRTARSVHIDGAARDAKALARNLRSNLNFSLAA